MESDPKKSNETSKQKSDSPKKDKPKKEETLEIAVNEEDEAPVHKKVKKSRDTEDSGKNKKQKKVREDLSDDSESSYRVFGFIGAGSIGSSIIKHLIAKFTSSESDDRLILWHTDKTILQDIDGVKVRAAISVDELLDQSDVIMWYIFTKRVSNMLFYDLIEFKDKIPGKYLIDLTNTDPQHALEVYDTVNDQGGFYLDVRLHGGSKEAREAKLVVFASGNIEAYEACKNYLSCFSVKMKYFGPEPDKAAKFSAQINVVKALNMECVGLLNTLGETQGPEFLEQLKKFLLVHSPSPLGPLTKKALEYKFEDEEDKNLTLECCKEDIESIIFSKNYNEAEQPMHCTRLLYKFIVDQYNAPEKPQSSQQMFGAETKEEE